MCWQCGAVRPYDGPNELRLPEYSHLLPSSGQIAVAREEADWEELNEWPEWEAVDSAGEPFFEIRDM